MMRRLGEVIAIIQILAVVTALGIGVWRIIDTKPDYHFAPVTAVQTCDTRDEVCADAVAWLKAHPESAAEVADRQARVAEAERVQVQQERQRAEDYRDSQARKKEDGDKVVSYLLLAGILFIQYLVFPMVAGGAVLWFLGTLFDGLSKARARNVADAIEQRRRES